MGGILLTKNGVNSFLTRSEEHKRPAKTSTIIWPEKKRGVPVLIKSLEGKTSGQMRPHSVEREFPILKSRKLD